MQLVDDDGEGSRSEETKMCVLDMINKKSREEVEELLQKYTGAESLLETFVIRQKYPDLDESVTEIMNKCCEASSAREVYVFIMDVFTTPGITWESKIYGLKILQKTLLRMTGEKQKKFVHSGMLFVKKHFEKCDLPPQETLAALWRFGCGFTDLAFHPQNEVFGSIALEDLVSVFLLYLLQRLLPLVGPYPSNKVSFEGYECVHDIIASIGRLARKFLQQPPVPGSESISQDDTGEGEASSLSKAAFIYLTEIHGLGPPWARISRVLNVQRRFLFLGWAVKVLIKNNYRNVAYQIFMESLAPLFPMVKDPIMDVTFYSTILEGIADASEKEFMPEDDTRVKLFSTWTALMQKVPYRPRVDYYVQIINTCKIDKLVGGVVTNARNDWWDHFQHYAEAKKTSEKLEFPILAYQALLMLQATLKGNIRIIDGMDTLVAGLNFARLIMMAPKCKFMFPELLGTREVSYFDKPMEELLGNISKQIDCEMETVAKSEVEKERIQMVAHLVARVKELIPNMKQALDAPDVIMKDAKESINGLAPIEEIVEPTH